MDPGWSCWSIDLKSFDGSQGQLADLEREECLRFAEAIDLEHLDDLKRCFKSQSRLNIRAKGLTSTILGNRASGTAGTSVANKLVMISALKHSMGLSYTQGRVKFYCDGDDTLIFVHPEAAQYESSWMRRMKELGLDTVVENRADKVEDIVFCRSRPVWFGEGKAMLVKNPADAFKTMCAVVRHFRGDALPAYFATLRDGYSRLWDGVPVMHALSSIYGHEDTRVNYKVLDADDNYKFGKEIVLSGGMPFEPTPITDAARASFFEATGIGLGAQLELESLAVSVGSQMPACIKSYMRTRNVTRRRVL